MNLLKTTPQYAQLPNTEKELLGSPEQEAPPRPWAHQLSWAIPAAVIAFFVGAIFGAELKSAPRLVLDGIGNIDAAKSFVPDIPSTIRTFPLKSALMHAPSPESDAAWESLIPVGYGFVNISDPQMYNLPPGVETENGPDTYSVAMFHQIHCLTHIRDRFWLLANTILDPTTIPLVLPEVEQEIKNHHTGHCLEYLAQSIQCSADLTIEWARVDKNGSRFDVDGGNVPHVCKDPDAIWDWMIANHAAPSKQSHRHTHLSSLVGNAHLEH